MILTERQTEVLKRLAVGTHVKAVAAELRVSPKTVAYHRTQILRRLGVSSLIAAVHWAIRKQIVPLLGLLLLAGPARGSTVSLGWEASPSIEVTSYVLYGGTNSLSLTNLATAFLKLNVGTNTTATAIWAGTNRIYFVTTAVAGAFESDPSNPLITQAPAAPANLLAVALTYQTSLTLPSTNALYLGLKILTPTP